MPLIAPNHIESGTGKLLAVETAAEQGADSGKYLIRKGQVIYSKIRPALRKATVAPFDCLCSADMYGLEPRPGLLRDRFLLEVVLSQPFTDFTFEASMRVAMPKINRESLGAGSVWFPTLEEQDRILTFIDRETAEIDELIDKQTRLIDLLDERRKAVITQAVTKGLDPSMSMKDSGVPWIGDIPAHWSIKQVGWFASVGNGSTPSRDQPAYWDDGWYPWLNSSVVNSGIVEGATQFVTTLALNECHLPRVAPSSVLIGLTGEGKTRGMCAVLGIPATISQHLAYVSPRGDDSPEFLRWTFTAAYEALREISDQNGSTKGGLTCFQVKKFLVPIPSPDEQGRIAAHVATSTAEIAQLGDRAAAMIGLLRERRAALITAAVTGHILVEEMV